LSDTGAAILDRLAAETGTPKTKIIELALSKLEQERFWNSVDAAYETHGAALKAEYEVLEGASDDGLEEFPA
jgi:hypothetical protein